jgi:hypothetical protein
LSPSNIVVSLPTVSGATSLIFVSNMMSSYRRQNHVTALWESEDTTENYIGSSVSLNGHNPGDTIPNLLDEIYHFVFFFQ